MEKHLLLLLIACLLSCSRESTSQQVLARVNGDVITVSQLQAELDKTKGGSLSQSIEFKKKVLQSLIDRQLFVQEAFKLSLERAPEVVRAIESTKAQIYAQAYLSRKIATLDPASSEEIDQFVHAHPEMFEHRKIINMRDVIFVNSPASLDMPTVEKEVLNLNDLQALLEKKAISYRVSSSQFSTDRLPQSILEKIQNLKTGDLLFLHNDNSVIVKSIESFVEQPIISSKAHDIAAQLLNQKQQQQFIMQEVSRLKGLSKVEVFDTAHQF